MTKSLWRYSHLMLAFVTVAFLVIASVTGFFLSLEPIFKTSQSHRIHQADTLALSHLVGRVSATYNEVYNISRDNYGNIEVDVFHNDKSQKFYVNPYNGKKAGEQFEIPYFFDFNRNLHRSLFLKQTGRFLIGLCSFLLLISTVTGILLIVKRQGGIHRFFHQIIKNEFYQDTHSSLGRIFFIPIIIIAITGTYLFMERFSMLPEFKINHQVDYESIKDAPQEKVTAFPVFTDYTIADLKEITFPFSTDVEDYFEVKLEDRELLINQKNGDILSEVSYSTTKKLYNLSFVLHTGESSIWWAIILGLSSLSILYFNFSGFKIYLKRDKTKFQNPYAADECSVIILVGSEHGSTLRFASSLQNSLTQEGQKVYIDEMNAVQTYKELSHLIILTATYGNGEAPSNADHFIHKIEKNPISKQPYFYSVIGFGSKSYPNYCQFAYDVDQILKRQKQSQELIPIHTINDKYFDAFKRWVYLLEDKLGHKIPISKEQLKPQNKKITSFEVLHKQYSENDGDATFLLELGHKNGVMKKYQSGDLIGVFPEKDAEERFYSVGFNQKNNSILLSIKLHPNGLCSNYLERLKTKDKVTAYLKHNSNFHLPKKAKKVIMIANGTGIAPFLGMIEANNLGKEIVLFWGGQNQASYSLYQPIISQALNEGKLQNVFTAFSREKEKKYVQDAVIEQTELIGKFLNKGSIIMVCGSLNMKVSVTRALNDICHFYFDKPYTYLEQQGLLKSDCY